ncbi:CHAT domain-containing protein [Psychroserpens luteolus]|uniref:CHAT domain-containing protein n=1 Tax=Psychroserpens luteolus TaxID=2855840 RepID=UPI001E314B4E|nr:CHAT domain-containing protein [Psychroserpens luteolus]MCD2258822.1 CHAT domain-containing protein [Psychroserpens luteolus]
MIKILFIKVNPIGTKNLRLGKEENEIRNALQVSTGRDDFEFHTRDAVTIEDLHRDLEQIKPNILHVSGHGSKEGVLFFNDNEGYKKEVDVIKFCDYLANYKAHVTCVFLNACFSLNGIDTLEKQHAHIIGMRDEIPNDTAVKFAKAFYTSHFNGKSVKESFNTAKSIVSMDDYDEDLIPKLLASEHLIKEDDDDNKLGESQLRLISEAEIENAKIESKQNIKEFTIWMIVLGTIAVVGTIFSIIYDQGKFLTTVSSAGPTSIIFFPFRWRMTEKECINAIAEMGIRRLQFLERPQLTDTEIETFNKQFFKIRELKLKRWIK